MPADFATFKQLWRRSVEATHHFLSSAQVDEIEEFLTPNILEDMEVMGLYSNANELIAFVCVSNRKLEMLFVDPAHFRKGIGRSLLSWAETERQANRLDVNEQNPEAVMFYSSMGYKVKARSDNDLQGRPFPLLHMEKL